MERTVREGREKRMRNSVMKKQQINRKVFRVRKRSGDMVRVNIFMAFFYSILFVPYLFPYRFFCLSRASVPRIQARCGKEVRPICVQCTFFVFPHFWHASGLFFNAVFAIVTNAAITTTATTTTVVAVAVKTATIFRTLYLLLSNFSDSNLQQSENCVNTWAKEGVTWKYTQRKMKKRRSTKRIEWRLSNLCQTYAIQWEEGLALVWFALLDMHSMIALAVVCASISHML